MQRVPIESAAKPGTEEYLLLLLASDAKETGGEEISEEELESYIKDNPDQGTMFDDETIAKAMRAVRSARSLLEKRH